MFRQQTKYKIKVLCFLFLRTSGLPNSIAPQNVSLSSLSPFGHSSKNRASFYLFSAEPYEMN